MHTLDAAWASGVRTGTHPPTGTLSSPCLMLREEKGLSRALPEFKEEKNLDTQWLPGLWDPKTPQRQGFNAGRQDVLVIRETAYHTGYKYELRCLPGWAQALDLQFTSCAPLAMLLTELCASVPLSVK